MQIINTLICLIIITKNISQLLEKSIKMPEEPVCKLYEEISAYSESTPRLSRATPALKPIFRKARSNHYNYPHANIPVKTLSSYHATLKCPHNQNNFGRKRRMNPNWLSQCTTCTWSRKPCGIFSTGNNALI